MFNVVYSAKDKIKNGIAQGTIPNESFIITNDSVVPESFYYDENSNLKQITKRLSFDSLAEARKWVNKYEYKGEFISVLQNDVYVPYMVDADNQLVAIPYKKEVILNDDTVVFNGGSME